MTVPGHRRESPQNKRSQKQKGKKTVAEMKQPSDLPNVKKHKSMDSDEDDEERPNELESSSTSQPIVPVLPLHQGPQEPTSSSQGPAALDNSADEGGETVFYTDLSVLTDGVH